MLTTSEIQGTRVIKQPGKRGQIGKVWRTVFSPDGKRAVGFIVKRPDLAMMVKRSDKFLALDSMGEDDGRIYATQGGASWDEAAIKRLGLDWDTCIIWDGMNVRTVDGVEIGHVGALSFNTTTGEIGDIHVTDGSASKAVVGNVIIPASYYLGYEDGYLVVTNEAGSIKPEGGLAAKAGEASAKAARGMHVAGKKANDALDAGSLELGKVLGKAKRKVSEFSPSSEDETINNALPVDNRSENNSHSGHDASSTSEKSMGKTVGKQTDKAARALGKQLSKSKGMFASFKEEFEKGNKSDD